MQESDVDGLLQQFREMQKMMKQMGIMGGGGKRKKKGGGRGMLPKGLSDMFGGLN
jgi:signal recognition particle GTPase